jgi:FkbM family methyltransferase
MRPEEINAEPKLTREFISKGVFKEDPLILVDVGVRGGFEDHWLIYKDQIKMIGFEADAEECEKLNNGNRSCDGVEYDVTYYPIALHSEEGKQHFYRTNYPPASGVYYPDPKIVGRFIDIINLQVKNTEMIDVIDFDTFAEGKIDHVDFFKLDTEGNELDILKGAKNHLKNALGVCVETEFYPIHDEQPVFADVDTFMRGEGFMLYSLDTHKWGRKDFYKFEHVKKVIPIGQVMIGQALYFKDPITNCENWSEKRILKMVSLMELFNHNDSAKELLKETIKKGKICGSI